MATLISSVARLEARIRDYHKEAAEMTAVMPYNVAWYALRAEKEWLFGPSKFIGYDDLNAKKYLEREKGSGLDGRVTESVLQKWAELVEEGHPKYDELHTALNEFCARFGKKPNSRARISIVKTKDEAASSVPVFPDDLVSLMVAVYRKLTPAQKSAFWKEVA
jgi:hypothetical protein